ncbi:MAG TPA: hypothetical protein VG165_00650 [Solirubrobacteraceae bacterium]|nr:hypothetical protein [Solirubrobacteraceae bacterium]
MPSYETIEQALDGLRDAQTFAELASAILIDQFPDLVMGARTGDLGRDAKVQCGVWGTERVVVQYSLAKNWRGKIDRELGRYDDDPSLPKRMIFVTHRTATEAAQKTRVDRAAAKYSVQLRILDRGWLWPRLQGRYRRLAEEFLGLRPALPGRFLPADDRRAQLERSIPGFRAPTIETQGRREVREAVAAAVTDAERKAPLGDNRRPPPRVVLLEGPGGMGKTRAALDGAGEGAAGLQALVLQAAQNFDREAVGALAPYEAGVVIVDDADRASDLSGVRLLLDDPAWRGWHVVMTLRPGLADETLERAGVLAAETRMVRFTGLNRPDAAQLVASPPYLITLPELAGHVVDLARGNPLMLHLAAQAIVNGDLMPGDQADLLRGYVRHMRRTLPNGLPADLVTMAALYGRLSATTDLVVVTHLHPAAALPEVRDALGRAADAGLGVFDGDVFTVTPDAIAPVLVLDELLSSGARRLSIDDFPLDQLDNDGATRERVISSLTGAVIHGGGVGRDHLRRFVLRRHPGPVAAPPGTWLPALREARIYAHALPQDARDLLEAFVRLPHDDQRAAPRVLAAAAETARELAEVSRQAGLPALLSIAALQLDDDRNALLSPRKSLAELLERSPSYGGAWLTQRAVEALAATRAWLQRDPGAAERQRIAMRVSILLVAVAYEFVAHSPADAMAVQLGAVPAPDTTEHRDAISNAAQFAAELIATAAPDALGELRDAYPELLHREMGISPSLVNELPEALRMMIREPVEVVRRAIIDAWDRVPIGVRLRVIGADDSPGVAGRSLADPELDRFATLFGVTRAGRRQTDEWGANLQRATELGRELGPDAALDLLELALDHADVDLRLSGGGNLMQGAGAAATRAPVAKAIRRMSADARLRPFLGALLSGALNGAGMHPKTLRALAANPNTAVHVVGVLDLVEAEEERPLRTLLLAQADTHVELAYHLARCERRDAADRADVLLGLAEASSDEALAQVLEPFGLHHGSLGVPEALRGRFADQMARVARSTALNRQDPGNLSEAFSLLVTHGGDAWLDVIDKRRAAMLESEAPGYRRLWNLLPDDFNVGTGELTDEQRNRAIPRIIRWLEQTDYDAHGWRVEMGLSELLPRVAEDRPALAEALARWYREGGAARHRTLRMLDELHGQAALEAVLDRLLAADASGEDGELIAALSTSPTGWVGDIEKEYLRRAEQFAKRTHRGTARARAFAAEAESHFRGLAEAERLNAHSRHEGYDG